jgi:FixJ family two-component response regulator
MRNPRRDVVLIEDDASLNQAVTRLLHAAGFHASAFASAEAALASDELGRADCLIVDVRLPGMSGLDLCAQLLGKAARPLVVVTAHDDPRIRARVAALGAQYLPKPFSGHELIDLVSRAIDRGAER